MSKKRKALIIIFSIMLFITIAVPLLINTSIINDFIKGRLETIIAGSINGECRLSNLRANIMYMEVDTIYLSNESIISQIEEIRAGISIYSLLTGKVLVNFIEIRNIFINIKERDEVSINDSIQPSFKLPSTYAYPFSGFPLHIDMKTIKIEELYVQYDTFALSNISLNSSISVDKNRAVFFYNLIGGNVDRYLSIIPSRGEIVLNEENIILNGDLNFEEMKLSYECIIRDSAIDIRDISGSVNLDTTSFGRICISGEGLFSLTGIYSQNYHFISMNSNIHDLKIDTFDIGSVVTKASLRNDSIIIENMQIRDSFIDIRVAGLMKLNEMPSSEMNIRIESFNTRYVKALKEIDADIWGNLEVKVNNEHSITVLTDNLRAAAGKDSINSLNGSITYDNGQLYINRLTMLFNKGILAVNGRVSKHDGNLYADFTDFDIMHFINIVRPQISAGGSINGTIQLEGGYSNPQADFLLDFSDISFEGLNVENAQLSGYLREGEELPDLLLTLKIINSSYGAISAPIGYMEINKNNMNIYSTASLFTNFGLLEYEGDYVYDYEKNKLNGLLKSLKITDKDKKIYLSKPVYVNIQKDTVEFSEVEFYGGDLYLSGNLRMTKDNIDAHLEFHEDSLLFVRQLLSDDIEGSFHFKADASGAIDNPSVNANIMAQALRYDKIDLDSVAISINYNNKILSVDTFSIQYRGHETTIDGKVFLNDFSDLTRDSLDLTLNASHIDGSFFSPLYEVFTVDSGYGDVIARIRGTLADPKITGNVYVNNADIYIVPLGTYVYNTNAIGLLSGDTLYVQEAKGVTANGKVELSGNVTKKGFMFDGYNFDIVASGAHIKGIDYVDASGDCRLNVKGTATVPSITGNLFVRDGVITFPLFGAETGGFSGSGTSVDSTYVDIYVNADGGVWIKNEVLDVELGGNLRVLKDVRKFKITGQAEVRRGYYYYIDRKFTVDNGYFTLLDSDKMIDAIVELNSYAKVRYNDIDGYKDATVYLDVTGNIEKPSITFYSDPEMGTEEIISILSFNSSLSALREVSTLSRALPEKALQMYIRSNYLTALSSSIGLDQLSLETSLLSEEKTAKLSIGKYINRNLFVSYTHDMFTFEKDMFKIEYSVGRNSQIVTERDEEGNINAGFQFKLRY